jgi:hypothetical protein
MLGSALAKSLSRKCRERLVRMEYANTRNGGLNSAFQTKRSE